MAWTRIQLTEDEQRIVNEERTSHPNLQVRDKMWTIWLLHCGLTRQKAAEIVGVSRHSAAICGCLSPRRIGRATAFERPKAGERIGRIS